MKLKLKLKNTVVQEATCCIVAGSQCDIVFLNTAVVTVHIHDFLSIIHIFVFNFLGLNTVFLRFPMQWTN